MKNKLTFLLAVLMTLLLTACGSDSTSEPQNTTDAASNTATASVQKEEQAETPAEQKAIDEGDLGDYHVKILEASLTQDYEGKPAVKVKYEFTNNGADATNFLIAISHKAFQDGVELSTAILSETSGEYENSMKDIKTGATVVCETAYELSNDSSPVEVECSELISLDSTKLTKAFSLT